MKKMKLDIALQSEYNCTQ